MDVDPLVTKLAQPTLFDLGETSFGALELFPSVWSAAEALTFPDVSTRRAGLERLAKLNAVRLSPLVAYLVATRLSDPDIELRTRVVQVVAEVLAPDNQGQAAPEPVLQQLKGYLSQMRTRQLFALLQVADFDPSSEPYIAALLNACPYAGHNLANIMTDRKALLGVRKQAAYFIGRVGYLDALPALERTAARLESRLSGQQSMPFATVEPCDESVLLPAVLDTLNLLRAP